VSISQRHDIARYDVTIEGKTWAVELEEMSEGRTRIAIDGRDRFVEARSLGGGAWSLLTRTEVVPEGAAAARILQVTPQAARLLQVNGTLEKLVIEVSHADGEPRTVTAAISVPRASVGTAAGPRDGDPSSPLTLRAPIPGKIVKIAVKVGDKVTAGQALLVLEAMKMENEIRAPRDGEVTTLHTADGASVDADQALVSLS
jgi:biotin carboxyl carrier protein